MQTREGVAGNGAARATIATEDMAWRGTPDRDNPRQERFMLTHGFASCSADWKANNMASRTAPSPDRQEAAREEEAGATPPSSHAPSDLLPSLAPPWSLAGGCEISFLCCSSPVLKPNLRTHELWGTFFIQTVALFLFLKWQPRQPGEN